MKYLFIDDDAITHLITVKQFQSISFDKAKEIAKFIKQEKESYSDGIIECFLETTHGGGVIVSKLSKLSKGAFFDFETYPEFRTLPEQQIITILQKSLKFIRRMGQGNVFGSSEKILDNDKALVYPFPFTTTDAYRVLLDRNPYSKRLAKRETNYVQIYCGTYENRNIQPNYNNIRKFYDSKDEIKKISKIINTVLTPLERPDSVLKTATLEAASYSIDGNLVFEDWLNHLTSSQLDFITRQITGPEKLEGGAGTGKTLSLILKIINHIKAAQAKNNAFRILFITHSTSTKNQIRDRFIAIHPEISKCISGDDSFHFLEINTLNDWCIQNLGRNLDESQLLERDAQDSKTHQYLLLEEIYNTAKEKEYPTYKNIISLELRKYIEDTNNERIIEMLQFEIGVTIKGRAEEDFDKYHKLLDARSPYSIPARNKSDLDFIYLIYSQYKERLSSVDQYDVDDIVLTSLGVLKTPIWRRRKNSEGFDFIVVDEAHLFNFNELSVFHNLLKVEASNKIIFAIDKTQAVGDRGLTENDVFQQLNLQLEVSKSKYTTIFRSSPDIVNLAYSVLTSGTSLFLDRFENPYGQSTDFSFTHEEEKLCEKPKAYAEDKYEKMIASSFSIAEEFATVLSCAKFEVLIVGCSDSIVEDLRKFASENNKPYELLKKRGDFDVLKNAKRTNRFVIGGIDYVGGLEFQAVVIVGIDKGRVPPAENERSYSFHFVNYAWHNRLYVAITRAKYRIALMYEKSRGLSPILQSAEENKYIHH